MAPVQPLRSTPFARIIPLAGTLLALGAGAHAQCSTWASSASTGFDDSVRALLAHDDGSGERLFAGGKFASAGGAAASGVAAWDGVAWAPLGAGLGGGDVLALASFDAGSGPMLFAGGSFTGAGAGAAGLAYWDGTSWSALPGSGVSLGVAGSAATVNALAVYDDGTGAALYLAGSFTSVGGVAATGLARWDGTSFSAVGDLGGGNARGLALAVYDEGAGPALFLGGNFTSVNGLEASNLARYDGSTWTDVERGVASTVGLSSVRAFSVFDDGQGSALYVGGNFDMAGGDQALNVARWDGALWSTVAGGTSETVEALASWDDGSAQGAALFAAGQFDTAGGTVVNGIARLDGGSWSALESGLGPLGAGERGYALAVYDDGTQRWPTLFAGGRFSSAGGQPAAHLAGWTNPCAAEASSYCTAGTTASGCSATLSATGYASRSLASGFSISAAGVEGSKDGLFFFSTNGAQAQPWGNGTSLQCVTPPVRRTGLQQGVGTSGACDGSFQLDFNAWMNAHPHAAPASGQTVFLQTWFRDPLNPSNQSTSMSDALTFAVAP